MLEGKLLKGVRVGLATSKVRRWRGRPIAIKGPMTSPVMADGGSNEAQLILGLGSLCCLRACFRIEHCLWANY